MNLPIGTLLQGGKYKIVRFVSSGGFGCTYEAEHTQMESHVAIKEFFVKAFCNRDSETGEVCLATQSAEELLAKLRKKFLEEARAVFNMRHPNVVRVMDIFEENGTAYYVMDYIDGTSLHDMVKQRGSLSEQEAVGYIRQVADALKYVHSLHRLHLDVKPGNIMVDNSGNAILIDFGTSKQYDEVGGENTTTLMGVNTKGYAPIEQVNTSFTQFSPATDIYALGATLYKLLTGTTPPSALSLGSDAETLQPLPTSVSLAVREAVYKAMQFRAKDRPQDVDSFLAILDGTNTHEDDKTELVDTQSGGGGPSQWKKIVIFVLLAMCVAIGAIVIYHKKDIERNVRWAIRVVQKQAKQPSSKKTYIMKNNSKTSHKAVEADQAEDLLAVPGDSLSGE